MFLECSAHQSDVEGCANLRDPAPVKPPMDLSHRSVPCLMLLDALHTQGFAPREEALAHVRRGAKVYDSRNVCLRSEAT